MIISHPSEALLVGSPQGFILGLMLLYIFIKNEEEKKYKPAVHNIYKHGKKLEEK